MTTPPGFSTDRQTKTRSHKMRTRNSRDTITIYEPNHIVKMGIKVWGEMVGELLLSRDLIWRLIVRDFAARFRQSILGIFWAFIPPLLMMVLFVWVRNNNFLPIDGTDMPYPAFVFLGQLVWLLFSHGTTHAANSLVAAGPMLTKINFPKEVLVLSSIGQTVFEFLLRLPLLAIVFWWTGFMPDLMIVTLPLVLLPMILLITGLGFFLSLFNAMIRDTGGMINIIVNVGMFATPVVYPPPTSGPHAFWIAVANPVSGFLMAARDIATSGTISEPRTYLYSVIISICIFLVGWRIMHITEPKIAERV